MKTTFILKDLTPQFYEGFGESIVGLLNMTDADKFTYLNKSRINLKITMKIGSGQFRDTVELNQLLRQPHAVQFKLESRKGYKLATFNHLKHCEGYYVQTTH